MTSHPGTAASGSDGQAHDSTSSTDVFAGLTAIDVIDGELVPRRSPVRR